MTLADAKDGQWLTVTHVEDADVSVQALRFGLDSGARIQIQKNIKGGPVIISKNELELAIGRELAKQIHVECLGVERLERLEQDKS